MKAEFGETFAAYNGDCVEVMREMPSASVDFSVFSPPFANLYVYSDDLRDMGNCKDEDEFFEQLGYMTGELFRVMRPGRLIAVHCKQLARYKGRDGAAGWHDFRGDIIRHYESYGFQYHSEVVIWTDPVMEMQKTKTQRLLYCNLRKDASVTGIGMPEYLCIFRKTPQDGDDIVPIRHYKENEERPDTADSELQIMDLPTWQRYASPVWFDIQRTDVLNAKVAREDRDEKHICLARGSRVLTRERGYVPIQDVEIGEHTLTHKGRWMPIVAKRMTAESAEVIKVKAQGVPGLVCTPNHKLWVRDASKWSGREAASAKATPPAWVRADKTLRSYLNLKTSGETVDGGHDHAFWWVVGRWIADGHWGVRGNAFLSIGRDKWEEYLRNAERFAGNTPIQRTALQVEIRDHGHVLRDVLEDCGNHADGKRLPAIAYTLDKYDATALLEGYLSGDGHLIEGRNTYQCSTVSYELALGLGYLAQMVYGASPCIHAGRPERESFIEGRKVHCKQEWIVSFDNPTSDRRKKPFILDDGCWKKVRSIEDAGHSEVWNIEVAEDHSYTAEGCIVKNCPLQLEVIRRAVRLWSNPGEVVLSPFMGIGSEGYVSLEQKRRFVGIELKPSYFNVAVGNLRTAEREANELTIFDFLECKVGA